MLRFFKLNDPYRLIPVLLILIALSIPIFLNSNITILELKDVMVGELLSDKILYVQLIDDTPWLLAWFDRWIFFLFGYSLLARHVLALLILFFQAAFFAILLIRHRAHIEANYLPALIFGLISFFSFDMLSLSAELLASTFLLFALGNLVQEIEFKVQQEETVFNVGLYIGLASLLVLSYSIFLMGSLLLLLLYARLSLRKSLLLILGFAFPHGALTILYFFRDGLPQFLEYFYLQNFLADSVSYISIQSVLILSIIILLYLFFALVMLNREARFTRYQSQFLQVMLIWLLFAAVEVWLTKKFSARSFITFVPPLAYLISHYLLFIRRKWLAETTLLFFVFSIILISTAARFDAMPQVDYSKLVVPKSSEDSIRQKKIMVLGNELNHYVGNQPATYFLNWNLSKKYFEEPDVFQHVVLVNECFERENPEVIIDKNGLMENIFINNPMLKKRYVKKQNTYWQRTTSK